MLTPDEQVLVSVLVSAIVRELRQEICAGSSLMPAPLRIAEAVSGSDEKSVIADDGAFGG
jgi:hypothetical protein